MESCEKILKPPEQDLSGHLDFNSGDITAHSPVPREITQCGDEKISVAETAMETKGETHGGQRPENHHDLLDELFDSTTTRSSNTRPAHLEDASDDLRLADFAGISEKDAESDLGNWSRPSTSTSRRAAGLTDDNGDLGNWSRPGSSGSRRAQRTGRTPDIVVDSVETVTLKDAASEKGWKGDESGSRRFSADESKENNNGDADMDFAVLEVDSSHLNVEASKQKTSLRKKGSLARRKRPTRSTITLPPASSDYLYMDTTGDKLGVSSPNLRSDDSELEKRTSSDDEKDETTVKKKYVPVKPPMLMPGLQDLNKSKLFSQERKKSHDEGQGQVRLTTKGQKDSQNMTIASQDVGGKNDVPATGRTTVREAPKPIRTDSAAFTKLGRAASLKTVPTPRRPNWDSEDSSHDHTLDVPGSSAPHRSASFQGGMYAPGGVRHPRNTRNSSDGEDAPEGNVTEAGNTQEDDSQNSSTGGLKTQYKAPVWLSEMKTKAGPSLGGGKTPRVSTMTSNKPVTKNGEESEITSRLEGLRKRGVQAEPAPKKLESEKPDWMKTAQEKTSRIADKLQIKPEAENGQRAEDKQAAVPPWASDLKKKNRTLGTTVQAPVHSETTSTSSTPSSTHSTPSTHSTNGEADNTPSLANNTGRELYTPSWMKTGRQLRNTPLPSSRDTPKATNGKASVVRGTPGTPMQLAEVPQWKLELAEKKKRRETDGDGKSDNSSGSAADDMADTSSSPTLPSWRQQLIERRRRSSHDLHKDNEKARGGGTGGTTGPDWAKQVEERRARLLKSGLLDKTTTGNKS